MLVDLVQIVVILMSLTYFFTKLLRFGDTVATITSSAYARVSSL